MIHAITQPFRWSLFSVRLALYWVHSAILFITKPGSRFLVFMPLSLGLFLARGLTHPPLEPLAATLSQSIGFDLLSIPFFIDIVLHLALVPFWFAYGFLGAALRPIVGALPTPSFPLPPRTAPTAPNEQLKALRATICVKRAGKPEEDAMEAAYAALPEELRVLIAAEPSALLPDHSRAPADARTR